MMLMIWALLGLSAAQDTESRRVRIMAAASLTDVLPQIAGEFAEATGAPEPLFSFSGSSTLAKQLMNGIQADGIILAHPQWVASLSERGWIGQGQAILSNELVVVVPREFPNPPQRLQDLTEPRFERIALARPEVPAGRYAAQALEYTDLMEALQPAVVRAPHVRAALGMAAMGAVDAAIVYRSDALAEPRVHTAIEIPGAAHEPIRYVAALTPRGQEYAPAEAFFAFLQNKSSAARFTAAGFGHLGTGGIAKREAVEIKATPVHTQEIVLRTIGIASASLALAALPALWFGWIMARRSFRGKALLSTVLLSPLVVPPVVTGWLLLQLLGPQGLLGGLHLVFTPAAAVIAGAVVGFPLFLILARQAFESVDVRYARIAQTLGLGETAAFFRITLPMALPGIAAGAILAFARALGEFGATAMVAGDMPGQTRTLALAVYALAERPGGSDAALGLVGISLVLAFIALVIYERLVWRQRRRSELHR